MPKLKTKKTLLKRIRVSSGGKLMKKPTQIGHLKVKWDASKRSSKKRRRSQSNRGHRRVLKRLLAKAGRKVK